MTPEDLCEKCANPSKCNANGCQGIVYGGFHGSDNLPKKLHRPVYGQFEILPIEIDREARSLWKETVIATDPPHVRRIMGDETKATNPKDAVGSDKLPIHLWPETATITGVLGMLDGMLKYGRSNWRAAGVRASIYIDACRRHLAAWAEGEDLDPDSGVPHLGHALACLAILVDAQAAGMLNDDRSFNGAGYRQLVEELTPHVARLKQKHADRDPKHWTAADNPQE